MDLKDGIKNLSQRVEQLKDNIQTEEATKNAFIMPFMQLLGYDVFNPLEVVPEYTADIGIKKGEKIDYAIFKDGKPTILIECKHWDKKLNLYEGQLLRYYHTSEAKFGLLTNGITYRFYSDLVEANKMDEKPFLEFDITDIKDNIIEELKKFHKSNFDANAISETAAELKYTSELKQILIKELNDPSPDFVRYFARIVYPGTVTAKILELFTSLTKKSFQQHINEVITGRLKTALSNEDQENKEVEEANKQELVADKIVTTEIEIESFMVVKSILRAKVDVSRIFYRDTQSYFSVLLDDNNRKLICRLYLNGNKKYVVFADEERKEYKYELNTIDDLYKYSEDFYKSLQKYLE